jgi:hypothetical protein
MVAKVAAAVNLETIVKRMDFFPLDLLHTSYVPHGFIRAGVQNEAEAERNLNPQP